MTTDSYLRGDVFKGPLTSEHIKEPRALAMLSLLQKEFIEANLAVADRNAWTTSLSIIEEWHTYSGATRRSYVIFQVQKLFDGRVCRGLVGVCSDTQDTIHAFRLDSRIDPVETPNWLLASIASPFTALWSWFAGAKKPLDAKASVEAI
jgi:hypothetical protein